MPFAPGQSGNPSGRPAVDPELRDAARKHTKRAIEILAKWMEGNDPRASVAACSQLLDRGYGKPAQAITGADGDNELKIVIRHLFATAGDGS